jgi:hypothetical protein
MERTLVSVFFNGMRRFWFQPERPLALPLLRIVLGAFTVGVLLPYDLRRMRGVIRRPAELMDPSPILQVLPIPFPLSPEELALFGTVTTIAGLCATVGLFTRPALLAFTGGSLYMVSAIAAWGYMTHARLGYVQVFAILSIAPGTTAWSVDRLLVWVWRRRVLPSTSQWSTLSGPLVPRWGTQLVLVLLATLFFAAGISKLRYGGPQWADGRTLGFYLDGGSTSAIPDPRRAGVHLAPHSVWDNGFSQLVGRASMSPEHTWRDGFGLESYVYHTIPTRFGRQAAHQPRLLAAMASSTMVLELAAPMLLVGPARNLYLVARCRILPRNQARDAGRVHVVGTVTSLSHRLPARGGPHCRSPEARASFILPGISRVRSRSVRTVSSWGYLAERRLVIHCPR